LRYKTYEGTGSGIWYRGGFQNWITISIELPSWFVLKAETRDNRFTRRLEFWSSYKFTPIFFG